MTKTVSRYRWPITGAVAALIVFMFAAGAMSTALYRQQFAAPQTASGRVDRPYPAPGFTLNTANGKTLSLSSYRGSVVALFFGYTFCPDVCPLELGKMASALKTLPADEARHVQVIFISVDPERDSPDRADQYAKQFDPSFAGATSGLASLTSLAKQYSVSFAKEDNGTPNYSVSHSAFFTVIDREGMVRSLILPDSQPDAIAAELRSLLHEQPVG